MININVANITSASDTGADADDELVIMFRMDNGYFDESIIEKIESLRCKFKIKGKEYPTLASHITDPTILFIKG